MSFLYPGLFSLFFSPLSFLCLIGGNPAYLFFRRCHHHHHPHSLLEANRPLNLVVVVIMMIKQGHNGPRDYHCFTIERGRRFLTLGPLYSLRRLFYW